MLLMIKSLCIRKSSKPFIKLILLSLSLHRLHMLDAKRTAILILAILDLHEYIFILISPNICHYKYSFTTLTQYFKKSTIPLRKMTV